MFCMPVICFQALHIILQCIQTSSREKSSLTHSASKCFTDATRLPDEIFTADKNTADRCSHSFRKANRNRIYYRTYLLCTISFSDDSIKQPCSVKVKFQVIFYAYIFYVTDSIKLITAAAAFIRCILETNEACFGKPV